MKGGLGASSKKTFFLLRIYEASEKGNEMNVGC
jgi:hypothetical protein